MSSTQILVIFILILGFVSSSTKTNLLLNICFQFNSCHSDDTYLKLIPAKFDSNVYHYTIDIPANYSFYTSTNSMRVEFYVLMNADNLNYGKQSVAKSVLFDATSERMLTSSDLAYSSNEMLLLSAQLSFDTDNMAMTRLVVYRFDDDIIQQSDPYFLTFQRHIVA